MPQILVDIGDYTFNPGASNIGTIVFTNVTIDNIEQIKPIVNGTTGLVIFNPATTGFFGTLAGNILTLEANTSGQNAADKLYICYNKPGVSDNYGVETALGHNPGQVIVQMQNFNQNLGTALEDIGDNGVLYELPYTAQTGNFTPGLIITGGTSSATALIVQDIDDGATGTLTVRNIVGTFVAETITDTSTGSASIAAEPTKVLSLGLPLVGTQMELICENTNDTSAGTGVRLVLVEFMEKATGMYTTEVVATDGHTATLFVSSDFFRFRSAVCIGFGSNSHPVMGATNLGTVLIRETATKKIRGLITIDTLGINDDFGFNTSLSSSYTVPIDSIGLPEFVYTDTPKGEDVIFRSLGSLTGGVSWTTIGNVNSYQNAGVEDFSPFPAFIPPLADFKIIGRSSNNGVQANSQLIIILAKI